MRFPGRRKASVRNEWTDRNAKLHGVAKLRHEIARRREDWQERMRDLAVESSGGISGRLVTLAQEAEEFAATVPGRTLLAVVCLTVAWLLLG